MNLLDIAIIIALVLFMLKGFYRGFLHTLAGIASYIVSWLLAMLFLPVISNAVQVDMKIMNIMLYYTEGSEYIKDVELSRLDISTIGSDQLRSILNSSNLPYPMAEKISKNIAKEAFSSQSISTLGDYFNQTIVCVFISILVFLALFVLFELVFSFIINGMDYTIPFHVLRHSDSLVGAGFGLVHGALFIFAVYTLLPIILTVMPFDFIKTILNESFFSPFFYNSNFILSMIPGV